MALRENWQIVEMRSDFALRLRVPSRMLEHALKQNRVICDLRKALQERVLREKGEGYRVVKFVKLERQPFRFDE